MGSFPWQGYRRRGQEPPNFGILLPDLKLYLFCFNHSVYGEYFFEDLYANGVINGNKGNFFSGLLS
jgi:hypothetical protein